MEKGETGEKIKKVLDTKNNHVLTEITSASNLGSEILSSSSTSTPSSFSYKVGEENEKQTKT